MAGFDGALVLVLVNMGDDVTPDWQTVAAQQSFSTETSREMLDGSVKGVDHALSSYGRQESTASLEGLVSYADGTQQALEDAMNDRTEVVLRYQVDATAAGGSAKTLEAAALVSSVSRSFPDNENSTFSAEFNLNERFTEVTP